MQHFQNSYWQFAEPRLVWFEGAEHAPASTEEEEATTKESTTDQPDPDIEPPPTEETDIVTKQDANEESETKQDETATNETEVQTAAGLTPLDQKNKEVSEKNINISQDNLQFYRETKEQLQGRLQSWVETSVSKYVDVVEDRLSVTQERMSRDMERQTRVIGDLTHSINNLDKKIISYIDEKAQLDRSDQRYKQLTRLIGDTIQDANVEQREKRREADQLMESFDETDISLDDKKGTYTETFADEEFNASDEVVLDQFEEGFHSKYIAKNLIEALRSQKPIIGLFGSAKTVNLDIAKREAQEIHQQMNPQQRDVFERWLNREVADAGLQQKVKFDGSGNLEVE